MCSGFSQAKLIFRKIRRAVSLPSDAHHLQAHPTQISKTQIREGDCSLVLLIVFVISAYLLRNNGD
jgi:hypothetical protein